MKITAFVYANKKKKFQIYGSLAPLRLMNLGIKDQGPSDYDLGGPLCTGNAEMLFFGAYSSICYIL